MTDEEGRKTELPRDLSKRATKLSALAGDLCAPKERRRFQALCERVVALAPRRNLVVHGLWVYRSDKDDEPHAVSWFKVPPGEPVNWVAPDELPDMAAEAGQISRDFYELMTERGDFAHMER